MLKPAIFQNGGCECWTSSNINYLKLEFPDKIYIDPKINVLCEAVPELRKHKFLILHGSHFEYYSNFEYYKKHWEHKNLRLLQPKLLNSMVYRSSLPNFMLLSSSENV